VCSIEASPHRKGSAYYAAYRYLLGDYRPYIYKTDDYGKSWKRLTDGSNGIPADTPTRVVREDPDREGLLYAGTEFGMYVSFDNGGHWQSLQLNLPNVPITDIKVHRKDLVVATQGRAFWILDNITPLHQLTAQTTSTDVRLLKPRDGYRTRTAPTVLGPNIDYYLPSVPSGPVTIEILDSSGALVNSYNSDAPRWWSRREGVARVQPPSRTTRMQRRSAAAGVGRRLGSRSSKAEPVRLGRPASVRRRRAAGAYQARLKTGGIVQTQPFTV
jgi:hypothetical protein